MVFDVAGDADLLKPHLSSVQEVLAAGPSFLLLTYHVPGGGYSLCFPLLPLFRHLLYHVLEHKHISLVSWTHSGITDALLIMNTKTRFSPRNRGEHSVT